MAEGDVEMEPPADLTLWVPPAAAWSVWLCGHLGQVLCKPLCSSLVSTYVSAAGSAGVSTSQPPPPPGFPASVEEFGPPWIA